MDKPSEQDLRSLVRACVANLNMQVVEEVAQLEVHLKSLLDEALVTGMVNTLKAWQNRGTVIFLEATEKETTEELTGGIQFCCKGTGSDRQSGRTRDSALIQPFDCFESFDKPMQSSQPLDPPGGWKKMKIPQPMYPHPLDPLDDELTEFCSNAEQNAISANNDGAQARERKADNEVECPKIDEPSEASQAAARIEPNDKLDSPRLDVHGDLALDNSPKSQAENDDDADRKGRPEVYIPTGRRYSFSSVSSRSGSSVSEDFSILGLVQSRMFESFFSIVIMLNCASMGVEAHRDAGRQYPASLNTGLTWCDHVFTLLFTCELFFRVKAYGLKSLWPNSSDNWWNFVDAVLVFSTGIMIAWLLPLAGLVLSVNTESGPLRSLTVFRAFRLVRIIKVVQRVPAFREAWMLIRGLTDSFRTLFWTCIVIFFVTYIFAIFGCVLISSELYAIYQRATDPRTSHFYTPEQIETLERLMKHMQGLDRTMYTLIQVLTLDSFHAFMSPMKDFISWSWIYWYAYIAVAVFVLMNLVTAIIVENAVETAQSDANHALQQKEKEVRREINELMHLFILMDADGSGSLSWDEFKDSFENDMLSAKWRLLDFRQHDCAELFELLDDGDGEIETKEFFDGLQRMRGTAMSKDVFRLQKKVNNIYECLRELREKLAISTPRSRSKSSCRSPMSPTTPRTRSKERSKSAPVADSAKVETATSEASTGRLAPLKL